MTTTSFGASVGRGPVHCVLLEIEDGHIVGQQTRTIDPGPYRLGRRSDLLASGFDLLSSRSENPVDASAVAVRTRRDLIAARLGARGDLRAAEVVREIDAVLRALDDSGAIARYEVTLVADIGAAGMRVHTVVDGAAVATVRTTSVAVAGTEPGFDTPHAAAEFVRSVIDNASAKPEALVLVGGGAQHAGIRDAIADVARAAKVESVTVDEPDAIAATGAALMAADRLAGAATSAPARLGSVLGGHSVRLTAAVMPVLVVAALAFAVLFAGYASGIIGPTGESTDRIQVPAFTPASEVAPESGTRDAAVSTTTLTGAETPVSTTVPRGDWSRGEDLVPPPVMTTFAPPPVTTYATRIPQRTTVPSATPTGTPSGTPTSTGGPQPSTPSGGTGPSTGAPGSGTGTPTAPSPTSEAPSTGAPGQGITTPNESSLQTPGAEGAQSPRQPSVPGQSSSTTAPTVTAPAA